MVLGHEGVGIIEELGPNTKHLKKGQRVGWGYQTDSCGYCQECITGHETHCAERAIYGETPSTLEQGSYSSHAIWREAYLFPIPDSITDAEAAPLQCGGATVFSALQDIRPNDTIGIVGVGGLGHLAIQFAAKLGCRVVVISGSNSKRDQALQLGAHKFVALKDQDPTILKDWWPLNRLIVTTSMLPAWDVLFPLLAPRALIYPLSVSENNLEIPSLLLIQGEYRIVGSMVATRAVQRDMLAFAALHGIKPVIEEFPMTEEGIKEAMDRLNSGKLRYRAVLLP